jgi:hypothetical protein
VPAALSKSTNAKFVGLVLHVNSKISSLIALMPLRPFVAGLLTLVERQLQVALRVRETV